MKRLFTAMLVGFSAVSFASVEVNGPLDNKMFNKEVNENKSYYETLGEMFQSGSKPEASKLIDVLWSGRCFEAEAPYKPVNAAYNFRQKRNADVGPLGDNVVTYEAGSIWAPSKAPNYYDEMTVSEVKFPKYYRAFDLDNSVAIRYGNSSESIISKLRLSGKYLVEELSKSKSDVGPLGDNYKVLVRCYYFIPEFAR